ncbi:MAG: hypothetical protein ACQESR_10225 [Planctomycetota bacterium]
MSAIARRTRHFFQAFRASCLLLLIPAGQVVADDFDMPQIDGDWWQVAGNPDLGEYTSEKQQPVDFGIWQAADGTWQIWSCIRGTKCGGNTRLFHRWEGKRLTDTDWMPMGIAMEADPSLGESVGGLQAPHVIKENGEYLMFYGDWGRICLAESTDGKKFTRVLNERGQPDLFSGPYDNTRDPMVMKHDGKYYCYYMGHKKDAKIQSAIFCRTSTDRSTWSDAVMVSGGGSPATQDRWYGGDAECPFVLARDGAFYLFRNQRYGPTNLNTQYRSEDPLDFGVDDDSKIIGTLPVAAPEIVLHGGRCFIAALKRDLGGIRIARLKWVSSEK